MIQSKSITLQTSDGPADVTVTQLPATAAVMLFTRLTKILGPAAGAFLRGDLGPALEALCSRLDENEVVAIMRALLGSARMGTVDLSPALFDIKFAGKIGEVFKLLRHALEVNFGDFYDALAAFGEAAKAGAAASTSTTSRGPSTT